ncbi:MAG: ABC transporter substrate-binding protein [Candidatus Hodarchaeota archaeon]
MFKTKSTQIGALAVVLIIGLAVGFGIGYYAAPKPEKLTPLIFTTGWTISGAGAWVLIGSAKGFFEEEGISLTVVRGYGGADSIGKIAAGTYDCGNGDLPTLINAMSEDPELDVLCIAIWGEVGGPSISVLKDSGITEPTDLRGKTIVSTAFDASRTYWPVFAEKTGVINPGEDPWEVVDWQLVDSTLRTPMVMEGEADAIAGYWTSVQREVLTLGRSLNEIQTFKYGDFFAFTGDVLVVKKSWATENPDLAKGLVKACARSIIYASEHTDEATQELLRREPLLEFDPEKQYLQWTLDGFLTETALEEGMSFQDDAFLNDLIDVVVDGFDLTRRPTIDEFYTREYLPPTEELKP